MKATAKRSSAARKATISQMLLDILERSGRTVYDLEASAEIPRRGLARFVSGERGLTLATLDRLALEMGLRLVEVGKPVGNRRQTPRANARAEGSTLRVDDHFREIPGLVEIGEEPECGPKADGPDHDDRMIVK